jgi:hypothetical protein
MDDNPYRSPQEATKSSKAIDHRQQKRWTIGSFIFLGPGILAAAWTLGEAIAWYAQPGIVDVAVPVALTISSAFTVACFLLAVWLRR